MTQYKVCKNREVEGREKLLTAGNVFTKRDIKGSVTSAIGKGLCEKFIDKKIKKSKGSEK